MMKASTVSKYENSQSEAKDVGHLEELNKPSPKDEVEKAVEEDKFVDVGSPSEKLNKLLLPDIKSDRAPWKPISILSNESLLPEPDAEAIENLEEYTGFTIAFKDNSVSSLRLKRQDSLKALEAILDVPKKAEDEKLDDSRQVIEVFSDARVGNVTKLPVNPYNRPEQIWTGLEVTVNKKDQIKKYVLLTRGLAKWIIDEEEAGLCALQSTDSGMNYWKVDTAEIVREKGKGPYVKLNIDEEHAVCFKPQKASDEELKRFMTENFWSSASVEEGVNHDSKDEFSK